MEQKSTVLELLKEYSSTADKGDIEDLEKLSSLIDGDKYKEAYKFFNKLDTFVRETIPEDVFIFLNLNRCGTGNYKTVNIVMKIKDNDLLADFRKQAVGQVILSASVQFPPDASDQEISMTLMHLESDIIKKAIEFDYDIVK